MYATIIQLLSFFVVGGCEERSPEPKPRWNPKPEQIRILEAIFNSGMVNPPRNEIRKIRAQLEEFGQVGDANVFYWFQNRKSRSKHKLRNSNNIQNSNNKITNKSPPPAPTSLSPTTTNTTITQFSPSNSSSSDNIVKISSPNSSSSSKEMINLLPPAFSIINGFSSDIIHLPTSPTFGGNSVANPTTYFHNETSLNNSEAFFFPASSPSSTTSSHQGFCFSEFSGLVQHQDVGPCTSLLLSEMMNNQKKQDHHTNKDLKSTIMNYPHHHLSFCVTASSSSSSVTPTTVLPTSMVPATTTTTTSVTVPSLVPQIQGKFFFGN